MTEHARHILVGSLTSLLGGYFEHLHAIENDPAVDSSDRAGVEARIVSGARCVLEEVLISEAYSAEEIACLLAAFTDALEELTPSDNIDVLYNED